MKSEKVLNVRRMVIIAIFGAITIVLGMTPWVLYLLGLQGPP